MKAQYYLSALPAFAVLLALAATPVALAQESMSKDAMGGDAMQEGAMGADAMKEGAMGSDAMNCEEAKDGAMTGCGDKAMSGDAMSGDTMEPAK